MARSRHISLGEARAVLVLLRLLSALPAALGCRFLSLEDNMAVAGAWRKGRSPPFGLNRLLKRRAAMTLATGIVMLLPWIDTLRMPADRISLQCLH